MQKVYQRINWENDPSDKSPINDTNLNKMDYALNELDNRMVEIGTANEDAEDFRNQAEAFANSASVSSASAKASADEVQEALNNAMWCEFKIIDGYLQYTKTSTLGMDFILNNGVLEVSI